MSLLEKLNIFNRLNIDDLTSTFLGLERRMQIAASIGIGILLLLFIFLPLSCVTAKLNEKETEYENYMHTVAEFYGVTSEYAALQSRLGSSEGSGSYAGKKLSDIIYDIAEKS